MEQSIQPNLNIFRDPIHFTAYGFGAGLIPKAPGTFGTLMAIPFYLMLQNLPIVYYGIWLLIAVSMGIWICHITARDLKMTDPAGVVWDEMVGYWITMCLAPKGLLWIIAGFILFRLFDIVKPWPISWLDRSVKGGLGIMLDDILAGIFAWLVLKGIAFFLLH